MDVENEVLPYLSGFAVHIPAIIELIYRNLPLSGKGRLAQTSKKFRHLFGVHQSWEGVQLPDYVVCCLDDRGES